MFCRDLSVCKMLGFRGLRSNLEQVIHLRCKYSWKRSHHPKACYSPFLTWGPANPQTPQSLHQAPPKSRLRCLLLSHTQPLKGFPARKLVTHSDVHCLGLSQLHCSQQPTLRVAGLCKLVLQPCLAPAFVNACLNLP